MKEKIKEFGENYHDVEVPIITHGFNQKCDCCDKFVSTRISIEHDSKDSSKDKRICPDCNIAITTYWKENHPNKIIPEKEY